jgi:hypothetical protein
MAIVRIKNQFNTTQIDERYSGMGLTGFGTVTLTSDPAPHPNPMIIGTVTVSGTLPQIALACTIPVNVVNVTQSGSNWTFHLRAQAWANASVSYWIFDQAAQTTVPTSGPRLIVRNPTTGVVVFHSNMKPLRLVESVQMTPPSDSLTNSIESNYIQSRTVPGGRAYAVIQGSLGLRSETFLSSSDLYATIPDPGYDIYDQRFMHTAASVNGNQIEAGLFAFEYYQNQQPDGTPNQSITRGNITFWIVDVTGYGGAIPSADTTLDALNWNNVAFTTTSNYGITNHTGINLSGIDQPIGLRATVSGYSGNLTNGIIRMLNYNGGAPIVLDSASWTGAAVLEGTVSNGQHIYFDLDATTASGMRSGSALVTVQNMSDSGVVIDTFPIEATVDSDNNYNLATDFTPTPVNWNNITGNGSGGYISQQGNSQTISAISTEITLQVNVTNMNCSGSADNGFQGDFTFYGIRNTSIATSELYKSQFGGSTSGSFQVIMQVGDTLEFVGQLSVSDMLDGYASGGGGCDVSVINLSDGSVVLDTFSVGLTANTSIF